MRPQRNLATRGLTLIELIVVVAIAAILAGLAAPSYTAYFARKRIEGAAAGLGTDLQYARSEAVQRNANVIVTFGSNCYVVHTAATSVACTQTSKTITPASAEIRTVQAEANATLTAQNALASISFDPVRAMGAFSPNTLASGAIVSASTGTNAQLRVDVSPVGRVRTCLAAGSLAGYSGC